MRRPSGHSLEPLWSDADSRASRVYEAGEKREEESSMSADLIESSMQLDVIM